MHTQCISTDMINMFYHCSLNRDYRNFYAIYEHNIKDSAEDLRRVNIENSHRCRFITKNLLMIFKFLRDYPFVDAKRVVPGCYEFETGDPELIADMKLSIDSKNWNPFYKKYSKIADFIIDQAYAQKALDLSIEWNNNFYTSFGAIENAKLSQIHPFVSKNSGEMMVIRPGRSPYSSITRQSTRSPSPNRSPENTPNRKGSFYRAARNEYSQNSSNQSYSGSYSQTNRKTWSNSEIDPAPRSLHFDYGSSNSQQQPANQGNRSLQPDYRISLTRHEEPLTCSENAGSVFFACCGNSTRTTGGFNNYTTPQSNQETVHTIAINYNPPVVRTQPIHISDDYYSTNSPPVPTRRTIGDRVYSNGIDDNQRVDYSSQSQQTGCLILSSKIEEKSSTRAHQETGTSYNLPNQEELRFKQQINVLLDKGYKSSQYQDSSPRSNAQLVGQDFNGDQSENYDNGFVQSTHWGRDGHEARQEPFNTIKDHAAITSFEPSRQQGTHLNATMNPPVSPKYKDVHQLHSSQPGIDLTKESTHSQMTNTKLESVAVDNLTSIGPYSKTHGVVSLGSEVVVDNQTASFKTTYSSNQELSQSHERPRPEIRDNTSEAEKFAEPTMTLGTETVASPEMHQETYGGCTLQPQSVVPSQTPIADNTRSDYKVLRQSKSLGQRSTEIIDNSTLRTGWKKATISSGDETRAHSDTHSKSDDGIPPYPQAGVRNWIPENAQLSPPEPLEHSLPESNGISVRSENWETPEPTTLPQDFSMVNDRADVETLKKHDGSFEDLGSDTVRPDDEDQNKKSSEDSEIVDDHRSSMSSINIDFSPVEDSVISTQSCFDLDDLRKTNDTPVESIDGNFDDELFKHQAEMSQVNREVGRTENLIAQELENMQRQQTIRPNNPDSMEDEDDNSEFNRQFEEIKRKHAEELRRIREERRRKQQKLDEELQKMRKESKERFRMFMTCIILKQRFEQQEDNWKDWIKDCRNNIVTLQKYFLLFEETYKRIFTGSKKKQPDSDDLEDFESEKFNFSRYVMNTYNALEADFETLKNIEQHYNDAMFLRVLQKCIADVAEMLIEIYTITYNLSSDSFSILDEQMSKLHIDLIYSTSKLRSVCSQAEDGKYQDVQFPRTESNYNFEEI